jgi:hypothetical protein
MAREYVALACDPRLLNQVVNVRAQLFDRWPGQGPVAVLELSTIPPELLPLGIRHRAAELWFARHRLWPISSCANANLVDRI